MINRLSNPINRNRSAAKISKVMSSSDNISKPEWLMGELSRHSLDLLLEVVPQPPKDACEQIPNSVNHLKY